MNKELKFSIFQTIVLAFNLLGALLGLGSYYFNSITKTLNPKFAMPDIYVIFTMSLSVLSIIVIISMIFWKKWSIYTFAILNVINCISGIYINEMDIKGLIIQTIILLIYLNVAYNLISKINKYNKQIT